MNNLRCKEVSERDPAAFVTYSDNICQSKWLDLQSNEFCSESRDTTVNTLSDILPDEDSSGKMNSVILRANDHGQGTVTKPADVFNR